MMPGQDAFLMRGSSVPAFRHDLRLAVQYICTVTPHSLAAAFAGGSRPGSKLISRGRAPGATLFHGDHGLLSFVLAAELIVEDSCTSLPAVPPLDLF